MTKPTNNTVSLTDAKQWVSAWRKKCPDNCKAFLIPAQDLTSALKEMDILVEQKDGTVVLDESKLENNGVRAYMAIDSKVSEGGGEKLLIVGTQAVQRKDGLVHIDLINDASMSKSDLIGSGIFDFTGPCPPECDPNSPLMNV